MRILLFFIPILLLMLSSCQECATCTTRYEGNGSSPYNTSEFTGEYCGDDLEIMRSKQGTSTDGGITITTTCQ